MGKYEDILYGINVTVCPVGHGRTDTLNFPTVTLIFVFLACLCVLFALLAYFLYNSIRVFNRRIREPAISSNMWIVFFGGVALRCTLDAARYGDDRTNGPLFFATFTVDGANALLLCLALNHQRKHRSASPPTNASRNKVLEGTPQSCARDVLGFLRSPETVFLCLFLLYLAMFVVQVVHGCQPLFYWLFLGAMWAQRLPTLVLCFQIVWSHGLVDGPSVQSKAVLAVGCLLNVVTFVPMGTWADLFPATCPFYFLSWMDFFNVLYAVELVLFFVFLRAEYLRNQEEAIWTTVSQIQDQFESRMR